MSVTLRALLVPAVAAVVGTSGFALMASNAVEESAAGEGRADVSGYEVTDITYGYGHRGGSNPTPANGGSGAITSVSFSLDKPASTVTAFVEQGSPSNAVEYRGCTESAAGSQRWTCTTGGGQALVVAATGLFVSAAQ